MMNPRPQIVLIMDGGIIHEIVGTVGADVTILDYDTDGLSKDDTVAIPRQGYGRRATCDGRSTDVDPAQVETILAAVTASVDAQYLNEMSEEINKRP